MLNGLSLFSGIGGIDVALSEWVRPLAYCEIDPYCQAVLTSRQSDGCLHQAPIWDDIRSFPGGLFNGGVVDIITAGFPCQDISVAGHGKGLAGERSGLFFEIVRLAKEIKPPFIFLENVAAIRSRGGLAVLNALAELGYDTRFCVISAASVGALHRRERWFLLAYAKHYGRPSPEIGGSATTGVSDASQGSQPAMQPEGMGTSGDVAYTNSASIRDKLRDLPKKNEGIGKSEECGKDNALESGNGRSDVADTESIGVQTRRNKIREQKRQPESMVSSLRTYWDETECPFCGVANGIPYQVDRIRALGNAVVKSQAKEAFKILMGLA